MDEASIPITITTQLSGDGREAVVLINGELDLDSADRVVDHVGSINGDTTSVVVDLTDVDFVDSSGIRALLLCRSALDGRGVRFGVVGAQPATLKVFRIAGVTEALGCEPEAISEPV
jgi:anti-sigma B factor antagonist